MKKPKPHVKAETEEVIETPFEAEETDMGEAVEPEMLGDPDATLGTPETPSLPPAPELPKGITYIAKYKKYHVEQPGTKINLGMFADLESAKHALATYKA
jgi:hypothetical protein